MTNTYSFDPAAQAEYSKETGTLEYKYAYLYPNDAPAYTGPCRSVTTGANGLSIGDIVPGVFTPVKVPGHPLPMNRHSPMVRGNKGRFVRSESERARGLKVKGQCSHRSPPSTDPPAPAATAELPEGPESAGTTSFQASLSVQ